MQNETYGKQYENYRELQIIFFVDNNCYMIISRDDTQINAYFNIMNKMKHNTKMEQILYYLDNFNNLIVYNIVNKK